MFNVSTGVLGTRADSNFCPMGGAESRGGSTTSPNGGAIGGIENRSNFAPMGGHEV